MARIKNAKTGSLSDRDIELTNLSREYVEALLTAERAWNFLQTITKKHELYESSLDDWHNKDMRVWAIWKKMKEQFLPLF